jgi:membrane protein YdbS with pleckstrin-like domain
MPSLLLMVLLILVIAALPAWPYSAGWSYYPSGGLGTILVVILILVLVGRI